MKIRSLLIICCLALTFSCTKEDNDELSSIENKDTVEETDPKIKDKPDDVKEDPKEPIKDRPKPKIEYGDNFIVFEPEATHSELGKWELRTPNHPDYHKGKSIEAINKGYLEFTGNTLNGGKPNSPLNYTFTCPKTATYSLVLRMYQPLKPKEPEDKRNDVWIKLAGNFTASGTWTTEDLKKDHKFFGRGVRKWGSIAGLEGHITVDGKRKSKKGRPLYNLIKGEEYTFTMSGRAQGTSIDYILFFEQSLKFEIGNKIDPAESIPELYRPSLLQ